MKKITKIESVKRWLLLGRTITQMQAINLWQYTRLADAVFVLNARGMNIVNLNKKPKYARYKLKEKEDIYPDYDRDDDGNLISCCGDILDEDIMICPTCKEHN